MPYRPPSGSGGGGIAGIDVQEGGGSVVAAATALNFVANDFTVTDEGSNIAGIALDASLFAGVFLAIDGSNRMQVGAEIRTLHGVLELEVSSELADQNDSFADSDLNTDFWLLDPSDESNVIQAEGAGFFEFEISGGNVTNMSQTTGFAMISTRNTYQGDFEVIARIVSSRVGSSITDNGVSLVVFNAADYTPGTAPTSANSAKSAGNWSSPFPDSYTTNITGTGGTKVDRASVTDWWMRITRVSGTIVTYFGTSDGSDTPPGSWTTLQTKVAAGLDDEVQFGLQYLATGTTGVGGSGSSARYHQFTVVSADTINSVSEIPGPAWKINISPDVEDDGTLLKLDYATSTSAVTAFEWIKTANGPQLSLGPDQDMLIGLDEDETAGDTMKIGLPDTASRRLILCDDGDIGADSGVAASSHPQLMFLNAAADRHMLMFVNDTHGVIECGVDEGWHLDLQRRTGDVRCFSSVDSEANQRIFKIYGYDDGDVAQRIHQIYPASDFLWIEPASTSLGLILRHDGGGGVDPTVRILQSGSTAHSVVSLSTVSSIPTVRMQHGGGADNRGYLEIQHRSTATTAPGVLDLRSKAGTGLFLTPTTAFRLAIWENSDPGDGTGTPDAHCSGVLSKTGSDFVLGDLVQDIDMGWRTDEPDDRIFFNAGGELKSIGFGACAAFAAIYNDGTSSGQTVNIGADDKCTQFTTNFGSDRGMTPDVANDEIDVLEDGIYYIAASFDFTANQNNTTVTFRAKIDGTTDIAMAVTDRKVGTGGDHGACAFSGLVALTATDTVSIFLTHDNGVSNVLITIDHCQLTLIKIGNA